MITITIAKKDLDEKLKVVASSLGGASNDISTHFLFRFNKAGALEVLSYNSRVFAWTVLDKAQVQGTGAGFTIEGKRLLAWLGSAPDAVVTISLEHDDQTKKDIVRLACGRGRGTFDTLDPTKFPVWDDGFAAAKVVATLPASELQQSISFVKPFISDDETRMPELCVTEVADGWFWATDKASAALLEVPSLKQSNMRIHFKDAPGILTFLASMGDDSIDVLETDKSLFLRCAGGLSGYGETRFAAKFPTVAVDRDESPHFQWTINRQEAISAVQMLVATAAGDAAKSLHVKWAPGGSFVFSMGSAAGVDDAIDVDVLEMRDSEALSSASTKDKPIEFPADGVFVGHKNLLKLLNLSQEETFALQAIRRPKGGYFRFSSGASPAQRLAIVAWKKQ